METSILPETSDEPNRGNKKLRSFIKHRKKDSVGVTPLKYKGTLWDKPKDSDPTPDELEPPVTETSRPYPDIVELRITSDGVQKLLENLNPYKSMGPNQIHPRVLKQLATAVAPIVAVIFNKSLHSGEVPEEGKCCSYL